MVKKKLVSTGDCFFSCFVYVVLIFFGLVCLFPMMYVISISLTPYEEYLRHGGMVFIPKTPTLDAYREFWHEPYLAECFAVTVEQTVFGTAVNIALTVLMAYPLAKADLVFRKFFTIFTLIPMLIGGGLIPTYLVVKKTGLTDSIWCYILPGAIWSYVLMITRAFFSQIDKSLLEAARIDGASEWTVLFKIVLPVSTPILATIGLMYGVGHWNEYFASIMYINKPEMRTLQVVLREVLNRSTELSVDVVVPAKTLQMAGVVFASMPVIIVYPFLQKYFTQGIMLGAIKG